MIDRIKKLIDQKEAKNIDGYIILNPLNVAYYINTKLEGTLLINKSEAVFLTDSRYIEEAKKTVSIKCIDVVIDKTYLDFFKTSKAVGFEESFVTIKGYEDILKEYKINKLVKANNIIEQARILKEPYEIDCIKRACSVTDSCYSFLKKYIKQGVTEKEIEAEIQKFFMLNADTVAFESIVASGKNSSMPHALVTTRKIENIDYITIDFGAKINGYCADMTRTIAPLNVPLEYIDIYNKVLKIQIECIAKIKPGVSVKELSDFANNQMKKLGYKMPHALGHGVGLNIHERPYISSMSKDILQENMCITVEPGIYIENKFGVRIEDTVLVTKNGCEVLTKSEKNIFKMLDI
ncbi:MAG: Xaa-Pro peptidase family protein [Clostridia bacterium]